MAPVSARALHYVLRVTDRARNILFFRDILGMKILRHEEFDEPCPIQSNGPYENRWSRTMVGYGPENKYFAIELTYNYSVLSYEMGNELRYISIKSKEVLKRAYINDYPVSFENNYYIVTSPDGYKFYVVADHQPMDSDPILEVCLNVFDMAAAKTFWVEFLGMHIRSEAPKFMLLAYNDTQTSLRLRQITEKIVRTTASGRLAFCVPSSVLPAMNENVKEENYIMKNSLMQLKTPGKATVSAIVLADNEGHEICFFDEEGFYKLAEMEPDAHKTLEKYVMKDPFQDADVRLGRRPGSMAIQ